MKNFNSIFNQLTAMPKRLAMVLTVLFTLGVGSMWGADYSKNEVWDFDKTGNTKWSGHKSDYCGACGNKSSAFNVYKTDITNFSNIDFSKYENVSLTIYVKAGTNGGTNSYTVKLIDANGNQVSTYTSTKSSGMGTGSNSSSAKESYVTFSPTVAFNGYKIEFPAKAYITQTRYVLTYDDKAASYTITAESNNTNYGTVSLSGTIITASPKTGYRVSTTTPYTISPTGSATVEPNGNTFTIAPSANTTITINFEAIPTHKVYFNTGGLVDIESVDVQEGQTYNITQTPASSLTQECEYNTFVGWTKSNTIANPSSKPTIVNSIEMESSDITLYAVYSKTEGGGGSAAEQGTTMFSENWKGCTNNTQPTQPTSSGSVVYNAADIDYVWYTPSGGSKTQTYTSGGPNSNENILISKNNGYWKVVGIPTGQAETLTLSFSKSGSGVLSVSTSTSNVSISGSTITIGSSSVNTFDLIFTNTKSGDNLRLDDISVVVAKAGATGSTTYSLTPECTTETTVTLNPNGGTISANGWRYENGVYKLTTEDESITLPEITRAGYTFDGWATSAGGGKVYNDKATINLDGTAVNLYAIWTPITYTITYELDGGTNHASNPANYTIETEDITLQDPNKTNHNFVGWYKESTFATPVTQIANGSTGNITLYAKWEEIPTTCTVTYDANGGEGTVTDTKSPYDNGATVTVVGNYGKLTKDGYAFTGWNTAADGSGDSYKAGKTFNITTNTTLYAQWCPAHWVLVTNKSEIEDDTRIIIAAKDNNVALSTTQNTNNRGQATITKKYNTVTFGNDVQTLSLVGLSNDLFALSITGQGFLYAAGSNSSNYLKTGSNTNGNGNWDIAISQGAALILAQGTNTNNQLKYNSTSSLFSCYGEDNKQKDVVIYKEVCKQGSYNVSSTLTNATAANNNPTTVDATATSLTLNYSADASYLLPETITVKMGGATLVSSTDYIWNQETGELTITVTGFYGDVDVVIEAEEDPCYGFVMSTVTATSTINSITLTWTEVAGATSYKVRLDEGEFTTATGLTHTFEGLSPKKTYNWEVQAVSDICEASKTGSTATQKETFTVSWSVNGTVTSTESVVDGESIQNTPSTPSNQTLEDCGANKFMGWSEESAGSTPQDAAYYGDLCSAEDMIAKYPSVEENKTFYAVFATASSGGGENTAQVFATSSLGNTNSVTTGFTISAEADKKDGYYQDGSGTKRYVQVMKSDVSTPMITVTPTSLTVTAKLGGGSEKNPLTNSVYAILLDADGNELGSAVVLTNKITAKTGSDFTASLPVENATDAYGVRVYHQKETSYNVRYYAISLSYKYNNTTYSNYVTNCCALAPATNLTVSGTTSNTATLTWTAPSPTTGITKLQVRNADNDAVVVDDVAVGTTTATITGLTECTKYNYYVASVGDCEVFSNTVTAQPFSNAKTVNYDYNGGSGSPESFTTSCTNQTITLPTAARTGYDFNGWYNAATGGTRVGGAGDTYEPATSPVTLYAQWTIKSYTVTWNPNGGNWGGSTANIVETYEYGAAINEPADPQRENGIFKGWNPSVPSNMPAGDKTYTAQWDMVYTLTFVDMNIGGITRTQTQQSSGENIVAPTANSEVCDMWTFIGWAPSNSLNGGTDKPTGFIAAGETILGSQITGNKTYYSVYSYNSDNTQEFEVGKSGTYLMYALSSGTKYYATTAKTGGFYGNPETSFATYGPSKFTLTYNKTENKYIIYHENTTSGRESNGYFELNTYDGNVDVESETPSLFTIQAGSNGAFIIRTDYSNKERSFGYDDSFTDYSGDNPIYFEPASEIQYYNAANCGVVKTYTMSFHNPFGDENALIWYDAEHEEQYYTDNPLNTSIDVFPTMVYNGWAFIGWTANQQYNEWIGEEYLDDENSATDDPASSFTIYSNTAGWAYTLNDNVTMYPVFTKYEDNEDIDLGSGGEYYMYFYRDASYYEDEYFGADNHYQRMYASSVALNSGAFTYTTLCNNAQIFEFIKEGDGWNIRVKNADGTYPTKSYLVNTNENDYDLVSTKPSSKWSITKEPEGDYTMWYKGNAINQTTPGFYVAKAREYSGGSSWNFKCYNKDNDASQFYYKVYLGTCENRVFSSNPSNKPIIQLSGDVYVTATNARGVMATSTLKVSARKLNANEQVNITSNSNDVYFSADRTVNFVKANKPTNTLTITASPSGVIEQDIYVHYKPSVEGDGTPANVVVSANLATPNPSVTDDQTIYVRNLPAQFVIATKVGSHWYALPADMNSATNPEGVLIKVDETNMTAKAPTTTVYTLWPVKTTATENDRYTTATGDAYGDRVRFGAVNYEQRGLWANNNKDDNTIRNYAVIDALGDDGIEAYEWKVTTTIANGHWQYTLQTDQENNQKYLRYWTAASGSPKWGTYAAGNNQLYFLPVTPYTEMDIEVMEWGTSSMVWRIEQNAPQKVNITYESNPSTAQEVNQIENSDLYLVEYNLQGKDCGIMTIDDGLGARKIIRTPILVSGEKTGSEYTTSPGRDICADCDIVILNGGKLTAYEAKSTGSHVDFANIYVYPGGKLVLDGYSLGVKQQVYLRGGYSWLNQSTYALPEVYLNGDINFNGSGNIIYDYYIQNYKYYQFALPYNVKLDSVTDESGAVDFPVWVKHYNGALRAADPHATSWEWYPSENGNADAYFKAGEGYIIAAQPRQVDGVKNRPLSIIRFPLGNTALSGAESDKRITTEAHGINGYNAGTVTANNVGWNFVGNPFLSTWKGDIGYKQLTKHPNEANWDGTYDWVDKNIKYITIMSAESGSDYAQYIASETELKPFFPFYLQETADGGRGTINFVAANRVKKAPALWNVEQDEREAYVQIEIAMDAVADQTGVFVGNKYSDDLDFDDYEKMFGTSTDLPKLWIMHDDKRMAFEAMSELKASNATPLGYRAPQEGKYLFDINLDASQLNEVEAIYLTDNETGVTFDLMMGAYEFESSAITYNDTRFLLRIVMKKEDVNEETGIEDIYFNRQQTMKFIHNGIMYIWHDGAIYDATGKQINSLVK